jgi:pimeloyl-ACP methyl ester carboxylesterase
VEASRRDLSISKEIRKIYVVAHDWGGPVAYSYAAAHSHNVRKMIILDTLLPGFGLEEVANFQAGSITFSKHYNLLSPDEKCDNQSDYFTHQSIFQFNADNL